MPRYFTWTNGEFQELTKPDTGTILVADSWRVHHGHTWGLADHLQRFFTGLAHQPAQVARSLDIDAVAFETRLAALLQRIGQDSGQDLFPRISIETHQASWRLIVLVRPAPRPRSTTSVLIPTYPDPRTRPLIKGPDIRLMGGLVSEASTDDVVLHDGTNVHETTTGALLLWQTPEHLVLCQSDSQLASISAQRIAHHARSHNIVVTSRPVPITELASGEYPIWFSNTVHGISPVSTVVHGTAEIQVVAHPDTAQWQRAWWANFAV